MQLPENDLVAEYLARELKRRGNGWVKWFTAAVLTLFGSAIGTSYAAGQYLAEIKAHSARAEYVAEDARACCVRQSERIDNLK